MDIGGVAAGRSAPYGRRFLAALLDWVVCLLLPFIASGALAMAGAALVSLWLVVVPLIVVCYFTIFLSRGGTPGMRAASIRVVARRTERPPGLGRALSRALMALLQAAAVFALFNFVFSDAPDTGYSGVDLAVLTASLLVVGSSVIGHLWMLVDRERQTLLDRVVGLVTQE